MEFRCSDQEVIRCHALVLACASPLIRTITSNSQFQFQDDILSLSVPDAEGVAVEQFLHALYSGSLPEDPAHLAQISDICHLLGIPVQLDEEPTNAIETVIEVVPDSCALCHKTKVRAGV